jgi:hypothetical protein
MPLAVLQTTLMPAPSLKQLQRAFAHVPGLTPYDARILGRDAFGVLVKDCSAEQAAALRGGLLSVGIETEVIDQALLPAVPVSKHVHRLDITPEHLVVYDPLNRTFRLEWQHITLVAAGAVRLSQFVPVRREPVYNPFLAIKGDAEFEALEGQTETRESTAEHLLADFVLRDGVLRYSLRADDFNFMTLGDRRTRDAAANFSAFMLDALACVPAAEKTLGAEALLNGQLFCYPSKNAYLEEIVWRLWQSKRNQ